MVVEESPASVVMSIRNGFSLPFCSLALCRKGVCVFCVCVCVCVVIPLILDVRFVDVPARVIQVEGHTGFLHLPSAVLASIFSCEKDSSVPVPRRAS